MNKTMAAHPTDADREELAEAINKSQDLALRVVKKKKKVADKKAKSLRRSVLQTSRDVSKKSMKKKLVGIDSEAMKKNQAEMRSSGELAGSGELGGSPG